MNVNLGQQYGTDQNLAARQRLWALRAPPFDLAEWVLGLAAPTPGLRALDVGCGNGVYLRAFAQRGVNAVALDRSFGMLRAAGDHPRLNGDAVALPFPDDTFDIVLAAHMLYHVEDRATAIRELRRVLRPGGVAVAATNGADHLGSLAALVEAAVAESNEGTNPTAAPKWAFHADAIRLFTLENGAEQLRAAFASVAMLRPDGVAPAVITDPSVVGGYVASVGDLYGPSAGVPWATVVERVTAAARAVIERDGAFRVASDSGAFVCR